MLVGAWQSGKCRDVGDVSACGAGRRVLLWKLRRRVLLCHMRTCLLVAHEDTCSCGTGRQVFLWHTRGHVSYWHTKTLRLVEHKKKCLLVAQEHVLLWYKVTRLLVPQEQMSLEEMHNLEFAHIQTIQPRSIREPHNTLKMGPTKCGAPG